MIVNPIRAGRLTRLALLAWDQTKSQVRELCRSQFCGSLLLKQAAQYSVPVVAMSRQEGIPNLLKRFRNKCEMNEDEVRLRFEPQRHRSENVPRGRTACSVKIRNAVTCRASKFHQLQTMVPLAVLSFGESGDQRRWSETPVSVVAFRPKGWNGLCPSSGTEYIVRSLRKLPWLLRIRVNLKPDKSKIRGAIIRDRCRSDGDQRLVP